MTTWMASAKCAGVIDFLTWPLDRTDACCRECPVINRCRAEGMTPRNLSPDSDERGPKRRPKQPPRQTLAEKNASRIKAISNALDAGDTGPAIAARYGVKTKSLYEWLSRKGERELAQRVAAVYGVRGIAA